MTYLSQHSQQLLKLKIINYKILIYISGISGLSELPGRVSGYPLPAKSNIIIPDPDPDPLPDSAG